MTQLYQRKRAISAVLPTAAQQYQSGYSTAIERRYSSRYPGLWFIGRNISDVLCFIYTALFPLLSPTG